MGSLIDEQGSDEDVRKRLKERITKPGPENMPCIFFESIENPNEVKKIVKNAKQELIQNIN